MAGAAAAAVEGTPAGVTEEDSPSFVPQNLGQSPAGATPAAADSVDGADNVKGAMPTLAWARLPALWSHREYIASVRQLPASTETNQILIDPTADGSGWFVERIPAQDRRRARLAKPAAVPRSRAISTRGRSIGWIC